jgi:hypothetical protein
MRIRPSRRRGSPGALDRAAAVRRPGKPKPAFSPLVKEHVTRLVVDVGNRAGAWRDAACDAELAFRCWQNAEQARRGEAAAVYLAAIEREEKAASEYSRALEACCNTVP